MSKPEDIPAEVWDEAFKAMPPVNQEAYDKSPFAMVLHLGFARAILAAEKRGEERERESCAAIVDDHLDRFGYMSLIQRKGWAGLRQIVSNAIRKRGE